MGPAAALTPLGTHGTTWSGSRTASDQDHGKISHSSTAEDGLKAAKGKGWQSLQRLGCCIHLNHSPSETPL